MTHIDVLEHRAGSVAASAAPGPVLVALKPFDGGDGTITFARWLAQRRHAELQAMSVIEMGDVGTSVAGLPPLPQDYYQRERDEVAEDLRSRVSRTSDLLPPRIDVVEGPPGSTVASTAAERRASTIVVGTGQHGLLGRFLYGERALEVVRNAESNVLVVPPYVEPPIERAIVAVDFSQASVRAAIAALEMVDTGGRLTLVHVESAARHLDGRDVRSEADVERRSRTLFARFLDALPNVPALQLDTITLRGDAVGALLRYTEEEEAQLIACGRRRQSLVKRLLVGSVSTALIRGAPCCVLVAPERLEDDDSDAQLVFGEARPSTDPTEWRSLLHELGERNSGRRARLSIEAAAPGGVESVDRGYLLLALEYDRRGERADIILGDPHVVGSHLTHRISGIRRIETVTDPDGREVRVEFDTKSGRCMLDFVGT
jgi:nucleotide-binding universal stress UspA family protein